MRRRSLRLGITTLLSATLLGGATPAVAYEMQRDSATSLRIILDSGEKIEQDNAAAAILAIATQRKEALVADGILSQDKADAAFEYYFGKARLNTARTDGNIYSTPLDFPWEPEERTQSLDGKQYTEAAVLDYLDMLGANYAQAVIRAELGEFTKDLPQAPAGNAVTSQSGQLPTIGETGSAFPDEFPAYAAALRDIVTITKQVNAPLEQAAVSHRDAGTVPEDAAANEHSGLSAFEGGLLATGIAALTSAAGFGWSALDWSEILSQLGQFFS